MILRVEWFGTVATVSLPENVAAPPAPVRPGLLTSAANSSEADLQIELAELGSAVEVRIDGERHSSAPTLELAWDMAWRELELQVAARSTDPVFVHAGAIAIGDQGFVLPGRSGAGKTTLVLHLVEALDATYYSDEYALLDHDAYLHPYARDPHVRASGGGRGAPTPIAKYTQRVGTVPVPVCGVLVVARVEGERWVPTPANPRDCALSLLDNAVGARTRTPAVMDAVGAVIRSAWCVKGSRDSLTEVSGWLRERVANG